MNLVLVHAASCDRQRVDIALSHYRDSDKASRYVISFMHMWIFALGVPVAVGLAVFHRLMSSEILGVLVSYNPVQ